MRRLWRDGEKGRGCADRGPVRRREGGAVISSEVPASAAEQKSPFLSGVPAPPPFPFPFQLLYIFYITLLKRDGMFILRDYSIRLTFVLSGFSCLTELQPLKGSYQGTSQANGVYDKKGQASPRTRLIP